MTFTIHQFEWSNCTPSTAIDRLENPFLYSRRKHVLFGPHFSVKEMSVFLTQSLSALDNPTWNLLFQCRVFSVMVTAGWHRKQPSHLCVKGRADVSTTESLPLSCSYMRPQQHQSLLSPPENLQHCCQEKCASFRVLIGVGSRGLPSSLMFWGINSFHMLIWYTPTQSNMY